ncbi:DUF423 domain-containing protein [Aurantibacter sp.]|uniref:DUF423 domain-containing protein n=1 Tax=Aurantibacter sp. TaxID=2807103 RepID=UPI0035C83205
MNKRILVTAVIFGLVSIVLGAFAAHGLKKELSPESLESFNTGVRYQMYHAFLLLFLGAFKTVSSRFKKIIFHLTVLGVICFSFSIYLLSTSVITGINFKSIGFITPIGGLLLILAWSMLLLGFIKNKKIK